MNVDPEPLTGDHALLEGSTLAAGEIVAAIAQADAARFALSIRQTLQECLDQLASAEPDLRNVLGNAELAERRLREAFHLRYHVPLSSQPSISRSWADASGLEDWIAGIDNAIALMEERRVPFFQTSRSVEQMRYASTFTGFLADRPVATQVTLRAAYEPVVSAGLPAAEQYFAERVPQLRAQLDATTAPLPVIGWLGEGAMSHEPIPGPGRLLLNVGFAVLSPLEVTLGAPGIAPGFSEPKIFTVRTGPFALPMLVDLDRDGGFATDSLESVNNTLLRLIALLPAGQLKVTVFDPSRLGESAKFLYDMGDSGEAIIGSKVKTTDRELAQALLELEEHITFVTQKYLQGTFESLTAYNVAAGDVAEPYRVLVLYDYPAGFFRPGGGLDDEALARLRKVVEVGRRCGVFTLIVTTPDFAGPFQEPVSSLPWLWAGWPPHPGWAALLTVGDAESSALTLTFAGPGTTGETQAERAQRGGSSIFLGPSQAVWHYAPDGAADPSTVAAILAQAERGIALADDVRISPDQVAALAHRKLSDAVARGTRIAEVVAVPSDPTTWWHGTSTEEIEAPFGRVGARDVSSLVLDGRTASGVLIGGRPGSGKSVLLHALISSLTQRCGPTELELYLVDFKEGVEFKVYATGGLPHARVVAIESDREFGLSVLKSLDEEITRRGAAFREGTGDEVNLATYRAKTGRSLPRVVLIIDEFHVLFERDDKIATEAAELLDRVVRQGRAFGVHCVLASQTIAGTAALGRHTLNLLPIRIALQCSDADSRLLLADDNADARLLTRPGEGILNTASGIREANVRFQAAFTTPDQRADSVNNLRVLAQSRGIDRQPVVYEGNEPVRIEDIPIEGIRGVLGGARLPLGLPLSLAGPIVAEMRREPGGNFLVIADDDAAEAVLTTAVASFVAANIEVDILDFGPLDARWLQSLSALQVQPVRHRDAAARLEVLANLVKERVELRDYKAPARICVLASLHRARELTSAAIEPADEFLETVLSEGPDVGIHVVAWCDKLVSLSRRLPSSAIREFGLRFLGPMSRDDSFTMIDSDLAATISLTQAVFDDHDRATSIKLRRFTAPSADWVMKLASGHD